MRGGDPGVEAATPTFDFVFVSRSPPSALEVTGGLDKEGHRAGRSDNDLVAGSAGCDGGVDKRLREEGFFANFSSLIPPYLRQDRSHAGARLGWPVVPPGRRSA
jgi:hypothetical protein